MKDLLQNTMFVKVMITNLAHILTSMLLSLIKRKGGGWISTLNFGNTVEKEKEQKSLRHSRGAWGTFSYISPTKICLVLKGFSEMSKPNNFLYIHF